MVEKSKKNLLMKESHHPCFVPPAYHVKNINCRFDVL